MDGFEFLRQLRARPWLHHHRVLLVSAAKFTAELGREAGVVGFLEKPFDLDRLVSVARAEMGA